MLTVAHSDATGELTVGDVGTVSALNNPRVSRASEWLHCWFANINVEVLASTLKHAPLAGGFEKGDCVVSKIAHSDGQGELKVGDVGTVDGPCSNSSCSDASERLHCSFPSISIDIPASALKHAPLAGSFAKGDRVVSMVAHSGVHGELKVGDTGAVEGPCSSSGCLDARERLHCSFRRGVISMNMLPSELKHAPLVGSFAKGDRVVSKIGYSGSAETAELKVGDVGTVDGPCSNPSLSRASERLHCSFPSISIDMPMSMITHAPLAGGFRKGDRVVSMVAHSDVHGELKVGDMGAVEGPCSNSGFLDARERLHCSFRNITNVPRMLRLNMLPSELKHASLATSVAKGGVGDRGVTGLDKACMLIYFENSTGEKVAAVDAKPSDTIHHLKVVLQQRLGIAAEQQRLVLAAMRLRDSRRIGEYPIRHRTALQLRLHGFVYLGLSLNGRRTVIERPEWRRFASLAAVAECRAASVLSVAFSPDGQTLASASSECSVQVWQVQSATLRSTLTGHTGWVMSVVFSCDGSLIGSASADCTIRLWHAVTGAPMSILHGHTGWGRSLAFAPNGSCLASASADGTIRLWRMQPGDTKAQASLLHGHTGQVMSPSICLYTCLYTCLYICPHTCLCTCHGHVHTHVYMPWSVWGQVMSLSFSADGSRLLSCSHDGSVRAWDIACGDGASTLDDVVDPQSRSMHR